MEQKTESAPASRRYAGFWIRLLAYIIDSIILSIIGYLVGGNNVVMYEQVGSSVSMSVNFFGWYSLIPLVYILGFWIWQSATPGKMVLGLKIIEENGQNLTVKGAILRLVGYLVSAITLCIGFLMIGFTKNKRGLHDMIAKTYVVRK